MQKIIKGFLSLIFLIPLNVLASDKIDESKFEVQISTSNPSAMYNSFAGREAVTIVRTMDFDVKVTHPIYKLLDIDLDIVRGNEEEEQGDTEEQSEVKELVNA